MNNRVFIKAVVQDQAQDYIMHEGLMVVDADFCRSCQCGFNSVGNVGCRWPDKRQQVFVDYFGQVSGKITSALQFQSFELVSGYLYQVIFS